MEPDAIEATLAKVDALDAALGEEVRDLVEALLEENATMEAALEGDVPAVEGEAV